MFHLDLLFAVLTMTQHLLSLFQRFFLQPAALYSSGYALLPLAAGARPGRRPAWPSHVKCGSGVSEDMPSATWAPANSAGLR